MRFFFCLILGFLTTFSFADDKYEEPFPVSMPEHIATLSTEHNLLVGDLVSPLSGQLCLEQTDLIVKGAQEIALTRSYIPPHLPVRTVNVGNDDEERHHFTRHLKKYYRGWTFLPHLRLIRLRTKAFILRVCEPNGLTLDYHVSGPTTTLISNSYGITNVVGGAPSGSYDPKNTRISASADGNSIIVHSPTGHIRHYLFTSFAHNDEIRSIYLLQKEILPNGKVLRYHYQAYQLISIESLDPKERYVYATLKLEGNPPYQNCRFIASNGQTATYNYEQKILAGKYTRHSKEGKRKTSFSIPFPALSSVSSPNYRYENAAYNERLFLTTFSGKDDVFFSVPGGFSNHYRIQQLQLPVGPNDTFIPAYQFHYDLPIAGSKGGSTTVTRHDGSYQIYRISSNLRISAIEFYNKSGQLLKTKQFEWNEERGWLKSVELKGHYKTTYAYDSSGNPIIETFIGDLAGNGTTETYTITRNYSKDGRNLLLQEAKEEGSTTFYTYLPNTNLITSKTIKDGDKILLQEIYDFDDAHNLTKKTIDDGIEHKITEYVLRQNQPFLHMTEWIIEKTILSEGPATEKILKKTQLTYDQWGNVSEEKVYDSNGSLVYTTVRTYNERGDILTETNPLGQEACYTYHDRGHPKTLLNFSHWLQENRIYDLQGRLRKVDKVSSERTHTTVFDYDPDDNLIKKTDYLKNDTTYSYEPFLKKPSKTVYPPISSNAVVSTAQYDALGNKIVNTDANGHSTIYKYNAYGSPTLIQLPCGGLETLRYYKNGKLKSRTDADGLTTTYTYDVCGHILTKSTPFSQESNTWSALHLLTHTDTENHTTTYTYDKAGRKKTEECCGRLIEWSYDPLGRIGTITRHNDKNTLCLTYGYDPLDHVIEEKKTDINGNLLFQINYTYDKDGNKESIIRSIQGQESVETFSYDPFHRLILHQDPLGFTTQISYLEDHTLQKIATDPNNTTTVTIKDAHNNLIKKEILNPENLPISSQENIYDPCCNLLEHHNHIFEGTIPRKTQITAYTYTPDNKIASLVRAFGTSDTRCTVYTYTPGNKLFEKTLPDGIVLHHTYHPLGYLEKLTSSDGKIHHTFAYDTLGHLRHAEDHVLHTSLERKPDPFGNILSETFNSSYTLNKTYDNFNRPLALQLPDESFITYTYDPVYLRQVTRHTYTHFYDSYDLSGNLNSENNGTIIHTFNLKTQQTALESPHLVQKCSYDPCGNLLTSDLNNSPSVYTYDDLSQLASENNRTYEFDSNYNPISSTNALDELVSSGKYDLNGNQILKKSITYTYDPLNRLLSATTPNSNVIFTYDPLGRRLSKTTNGTTEYYLYDNDHEIASLSADNSLKQLRIPGLDQPPFPPISIAFEIDNKLLIPYHDIQENLRVVLDSSQSILSTYDYTAFGQEIFTPSLFIPWRYASKRVDPELNLIYFGHRYYDPQLGRWLTTDPAGFRDSSNLYQYLFNNPFRYTDPDGRFIFLAIPLLGITISSITEAVIATATVAAIAYAGKEAAHGINHWLNHKAKKDSVKLERVFAGHTPNPAATIKELNKEARHTPDQEALSEFVKEYGRKGVSNTDADTLLEWAEEYDFPARDDRGKPPHWEGGEHIHLGPKHIRVND